MGFLVFSNTYYLFSYSYRLVRAKHFVPMGAHGHKMFGSNVGDGVLGII